MSAFVLHERLAADCHVLGDWPFARVLLMDDRRWPWLILVPRRAGIAELHELAAPDCARLWHESALLSVALRAVAPCERLNVAALGNVVPQLHLHHVARNPGDPNWPRPVWGFGAREPYPADAVRAFARAIAEVLPEPLAPVA